MAVRDCVLVRGRSQPITSSSQLIQPDRVKLSDSGCSHLRLSTVFIPIADTLRQMYGKKQATLLLSAVDTGVHGAQSAIVVFLLLHSIALLLASDAGDRTFLRLSFFPTSLHSVLRSSPRSSPPSLPGCWRWLWWRLPVSAASILEKVVPFLPISSISWATVCYVLFASVCGCIIDLDHFVKGSSKVLSLSERPPLHRLPFAAAAVVCLALLLRVCRFAFEKVSERVRETIPKRIDKEGRTKKEEGKRSSFVFRKRFHCSRFRAITSKANDLGEGEGEMETVLSRNKEWRQAKDHEEEENAKAGLSESGRSLSNVGHYRLEAVSGAAVAQAGAKGDHRNSNDAFDTNTESKPLPALLLVREPNDDAFELTELAQAERNRQSPSVEYTTGHVSISSISPFGVELSVAFLTVFSHLLRDAQHRGFTLSPFPFSDTAPVSHLLYVVVLAVLSPTLGWLLSRRVRITFDNPSS